MTIVDVKAQARLDAYATRKQVHDADRSARACEVLVDAVLSRPGRIVSGYMPIRTEIDIRPALRVLSEGRRLCMPVVPGPARPLQFRIWTPETKMTEGAFGALIPDGTEQVDPDILILPLLSFDRRGFRLGYGGGFYDRTLERLRASKAVHAIGFAYAAQEVSQVPTEPTDQPMDAVVTENGERRF